VPLNTTIAGNLSSIQDEYNLRSSMTAGLCYGLFSGGDVPQPKADYQRFPFGAVRKLVEQYASIQKYFYGDFYPLMEYTQTEDAWLVYQLDLFGAGEGIVVAIKRPLSSFTQAAYPLHALAPGATYEVTNLDSRETRTMAGGDLNARGLQISLLGKPDSAVFRYVAKRG
jgi:hypothetical protein